MPDFSRPIWEQQNWRTYQNPPQRNMNMPRNLKGRMVNKLDEITPQEVPMDGSMSFFPMPDYSCIYAKIWGQDGMIKTFKYVPEVEEPQPPQQDPVLAMIGNLAKALDDRLNAMEAKLLGGNNPAPQETAPKSKSKNQKAEEEV